MGENDEPPPGRLILKGAFSVALIPETRRRTTLDGLREGDAVNVETDVMPKYRSWFGHPPRPALAWSGLGRLVSRSGHTEAAVALARWAGRPPVALCCEVAAVDGEMARLPELELFAAEHELPMVTIDDLVAHARRTAPELGRVSCRFRP